MDLLIDLTDNDFQGYIMETDKPVIACFWCSRVPGYEKLRSKLHKMAYSRYSRLRVVCIDVDENQGVATRLGIKNVPCFKYFLEGKEIPVLPGMVR